MLNIKYVLQNLPTSKSKWQTNIVSGQVSSFVVLQLHMLSIPALILAAHTSVGDWWLIRVTLLLGDKDMGWSWYSRSLQLG